MVRTQSWAPILILCLCFGPVWASAEEASGPFAADSLLVGLSSGRFPACEGLSRGLSLCGAGVAGYYAPPGPRLAYRWSPPEEGRANLFVRLAEMFVDHFHSADIGRLRFKFRIILE